MIKYTDSEVKVFHPLCGKALNNALIALGKNTDYEVLHHQRTGTLEMDYAIRNKKTRQYFCVIEVKRTPGDVQSTRYQFQAQSYVQMNDGQNEETFYIITNLEKLIGFRYDARKPRTYQQMLKPGLEHICDFTSDSESNIVDKLSTAFERILGAYYKGSYAYLTTLEDFITYMKAMKDSDKKWKSSMAVFMYEYIRGAFTAVGRNDLKHDVRKFHNDVEQICREANRVDFDGIFRYWAPIFLPKISAPPALLSDLYTFGNVNISGAAVAEALYSELTVHTQHDGEVATDAELALLAATLAKKAHGKLGVNRKICDPAAGSGSLICAAIPVFHLPASAIKANDSNEKFIELLSLRLGLSFPSGINRADAPEISAQNLVHLDPDYFRDVDVVLLNPPFVAGINCVRRKQDFYEKIEALTGYDAETLSGQMNLGAVFLETVCHMVNPGTTIVCIFPKAHLTARGNEAVIFRRMLLHVFGLHTIFHYPAEGLFDGVTEETCILVGNVKTKAPGIAVYSSDDKVANIDLHALETHSGALSTIAFTNVIPGVEGRLFTWAELDADTEGGWRKACSEMTESLDFVSHHILSHAKLDYIGRTTEKYRRGNVGASGGSDLMFFDTIQELQDKYPTIPLEGGLRHAQLETFELLCGDAGFLDFNAISPKLADDIIQAYLPLQRIAAGQQRMKKTAADLQKIARRNGKVVFRENSVLVPTKIRKTGRVYITRVPLHISTNFVVFTYRRQEEAEIIASYMTTLFYQLECEVQSKDHAGLRKSELKDVKATHVPAPSALTAAEIAEIKAEIPNITFLNLNAPKIRKIDEIWAKILFGAEAQKLLEEAERLVRFLANRRNPPSR